MKKNGMPKDEIVFPLGGIGSGSIGITAKGVLCDWEIFGRPNKGSYNKFSHFALTAETGGKRYVRALVGDCDREFVGRLENNFGHGAVQSTMSGLPHFKRVGFKGKFPFAELKFSDDEFPSEPVLTAFNPFIPLDEDDSSLPAAMFELKLKGFGDAPVTYTAALSVTNPFLESRNALVRGDGYEGVSLHNAAVTDPDAVGYGDLTVATVDDVGAGAQEYWHRGKWFEGIITFWNELRNGKFPDRHYDGPREKKSGMDACTVYRTVTLAPNEERTVRFVITWSIPNAYNYWSPVRDENGRDVTWKNHYATRFADSRATAAYCFGKWDKLEGGSRRFTRELYSATLDHAMIDAAASNLSVLKSSAMMRLQNGELYGFEGTSAHSGSCEGSCQHVWNYAYSTCFLFPRLERSMRDVELEHALYESGMTDFRVKLPLGRREPGLACVDGQMGTVVKIYREWKLSGDDAWLKKCWPSVKKMIAYAWSEENPHAWDRDKDGYLEGRCHNTLDVEMFGPCGWLEGFYLAALKSGAEMAAYLGDAEAENEYRALFSAGYERTKRELFNGEYFDHKVDLDDRSVLEKYDADPYVYWHPDVNELKYQIGEGCEIDQVAAQWHADLVGLGEIFDPDQKNKALGSIMKYNFRQSFRDFDNPWRIYALQDEAGTIVCSYPEGKRRPYTSAPYSDECWTGTEYQFAGSLIAAGRWDDAVRIVRAVRDRYDGVKRNPYSEIECGSNYARSMASYALIPLAAGYKFDLPHKTLGFDPRAPYSRFRAPWGVDGAWGSVAIDKKNGTVKLSVIAGAVTLSALELPFAKRVTSVTVDGKKTEFSARGGVVRFPESAVKKSVLVRYTD